ncbi:LysM peptidoglycan-binding domain-containing protein [Streptomyces sp. NBC_00536]|uniref:LysM peptidoglycan-binding domain-containing protein n=1 Tax=Streptomyces sp. NBC_00536 TaxID=2975769 RepID=UPI002E8163EF|nr:LysM domain-containing protein [Streptomyces sp. NBC_00536]WUC80096.1 LysM peptidoglycan-binding domain-containing protein [Streptomyces sp. NBC_00536]
MGIFDFLKSDKKKAHDAAEKAKEQVEQQAAARSAPAASAPADTAIKYTDASATATKEAADRMAAQARAAAQAVTPPKPAPVAPKPAAAAPAPPRPAPMAPKPAPAAKKRTYTVRSGDSLSAIARRELGNEARWRELYAMNKGVVGSNPDLIRPGMVLTLPN